MNIGVGVTWFYYGERRNFLRRQCDGRTDYHHLIGKLLLVSTSATAGVGSMAVKRWKYDSDKTRIVRPAHIDCPRWKIFSYICVHGRRQTPLAGVETIGRLLGLLLFESKLLMRLSIKANFVRGETNALSRSLAGLSDSNQTRGGSNFSLNSSKWVKLQLPPGVRPLGIRLLIQHMLVCDKTVLNIVCINFFLLFYYTFFATITACSSI